MQLKQQRGDTGVGGSLDAAVGGVVGVVFRQQRFEQRTVRSGWHGQLHQPPGPVAERGAHLLPRALRQAVAGERAVHGGGQVAECVEQRAVEVKKYGCVVHKTYLLCSGTLIAHFPPAVNRKNKLTSAAEYATIMQRAGRASIYVWNSAWRSTQVAEGAPLLRE